ncbi:hypothetical protein MJI37_32330, partial [Salmonella enterica subsp. enterica serovar Cerro]|nr:hypothetical protein [Salmonella enterica subsp. enterica serovar Cerro]
ARLAKAVCEAGVKLLEPNHPALALARGHKGVSNMHAAEQIRHLVNSEPYAGGWIFKIKASDESELESLLDATAYEALLEDE